MRQLHGTMLNITDCECELAGYCARHKVKKPSQWVDFCQNDSRYFDAWERGEGPGQQVVGAGSPPVARKSKQRVRASREEVIELGRKLWAELHGYKQSGDWSPREARRWLKSWTSRVPNYSCNCRNHWRSIVRKNPPDFSSNQAFAAWAVARHNDVNDRLGKPQYPEPVPKKNSSVE